MPFIFISFREENCFLACLARLSNIYLLFIIEEGFFTYFPGKLKIVFLVYTLKNKRLVLIACASVASAICAPPAFAQTYLNDCDSSSYVVLPGGQCMDLGYLEILGASRATRQQVEGAYQRQFNANVELETIYNQFPQLDDETEEEREARYRSLAETSSVRDEVAAGNEEVESILFPIHVRTMSIMRDAFAPYSYSNR